MAITKCYQRSSKIKHKCLAHVIEQPIFRIPNVLFVYFFIDFFVKHIFFEARLVRVIDCATFDQAKNKINKISL